MQAFCSTCMRSKTARVPHTLTPKCQSLNGADKASQTWATRQEKLILCRVAFHFLPLSFPFLSNLDCGSRHPRQARGILDFLDSNLDPSFPFPFFS